MRKGQVFFFGVKLCVLGYLSFALGYFALLGIFIGGNDLFAPSAYQVEHIVYFSLGVSGLLGLMGLWVATLARRWLHKKWLAYLTVALLVSGILSGISLLYFYLTLGTVTWKTTDFLALGLIASPMVWGVQLIRIVRNTQSTSYAYKLEQT